MKRWVGEGSYDEIEAEIRRLLVAAKPGIQLPAVSPDGVARFDRSGMIRLVAHASQGKHVLTLIASDPGLRAFVFTFGP